MGVKLVSSSGGSVELVAPTTASNYQLTVPATADTLATQSYVGQFATMRNRIINGAMMIDQRNAGASVTPANGQFSVDRWRGQLSQASKYSMQQNAGSVTPPAGFTNYLGVTSLSAYSVGASDFFDIRQVVEGFNIADLGWGTASAQAVTLSFWVRSSLTGTFGGALKNNAADRSYPFTYAISTANTWEYKTVTVPGDTSGTWLTTNGGGITLQLGLGVGSTYSATAGSWAAGNYLSATGATSVVGTNGATFYITGVQLEKGSTATSFDYRPYGTELTLCQRYFEVGVNSIQAYGNGANGVFGYASFKAVKRATPTLVDIGRTYNGFTLVDFMVNAANPSYADNFSSAYSACISANYSAAPATGMVRYQSFFTASAEL